MRSSLKAFGIGFGGALVAVLLAALVWTAWLTYVRAVNGEAAFEFLQRQMQTQSGRGAPTASPTPTK